MIAGKGLVTVLVVHEIQPRTEEKSRVKILRKLAQLSHLAHLAGLARTELHAFWGAAC